MKTSARACRQPMVSPDMCGETMTPGRSHSGESAVRGSRSTTSRAAPAIRPSLRASIRSGSTTRPPRPTLITRARAGRAARAVASSRPRVASVSGAASTSQSASGSSAGRSSNACTPPAARRPTISTAIPTAPSMRAMARPIGPLPTTTARVPATAWVSRWCHSRWDCAASVPGRSFAIASTSPRTYSATGASNTPRELVRTTSESSRPGNSSRSTPALAVCTQRRALVSVPGHASRTASDRKSQTSSTSVPGRAAARPSESVTRRGASRSRPCGAPSPCRTVTTQSWR